jgi:hypothetical protein
MSKRAIFIAEIDSAELACRIFEGLNGITRPDGLTARQALATVDATDPGVHDRLMEATRRAAEYLTECVKSGKQPS